MTLLAYWPLNESSGSTAHDHSGNENHGTINDGGDSTVPGATGILGGEAYSFDGSNDYVEVPDGSYTEKTDFTVSVWINADSLSGESWIFAPYYDGTDHPFHLRIYEGDLQLREYSGGESFISTSISTGTWLHVVGIHNDSTGESKLYVNGELKDSGTIDQQADASGVYGIGSFYRDSGWDKSDGFNGKISELRVYDRPLTKSEIQYLYSVESRGLQTTSKKTS